MLLAPPVHKAEEPMLASAQAVGSLQKNPFARKARMVASIAWTFGNAFVKREILRVSLLFAQTEVLTFVSVLSLILGFVRRRLRKLMPGCFSHRIATLWRH
eukprot:TRINITY_DN7384_c0_g1_i2.p2 TRINITY_DN7384_c0_g1~~TRINITY_DN7384_c0_g1_i2.p2  ORF type:complete len:101 (-),score=2.46 TRINITY_DN7384_c0_g1_i2:348-650(-)